MRDEEECYIQYKHFGTTITFDGLDNGMDMEEFHTLCQKLALAIGFHPSSVEEYFGEEEHMEIVDTLRNKLDACLLEKEEDEYYGC